MNSVCVLDFSGRVAKRYVSFWADYNVSEKTTYFGGLFYKVPPIQTEAEPTEQTVLDHAYEWIFQNFDSIDNYISVVFKELENEE